MKFGTCNEYFENWPLEQVFDYAAELGYDGVELMVWAESVSQDIDAVAAMEDADVEATLSDAGLIRHRAKLFAIRDNARAALALGADGEAPGPDNIDFDFLEKQCKSYLIVQYVNHRFDTFN